MYCIGTHAPADDFKQAANGLCPVLPRVPVRSIRSVVAWSLPTLLPSTGVMLRDRIPSAAIMEQITFRTTVGVELSTNSRVAIEPEVDDE